MSYGISSSIRGSNVAQDPAVILRSILCVVRDSLKASSSGASSVRSAGTVGSGTGRGGDCDSRYAEEALEKSALGRLEGDTLP